MGIGPEFPAIVLRKMMIHQWIWGYPIFKQTQNLLMGIYLLISKFGRWTMVNKKRNVVHLRLDVIDCPGLVIRYSMLADEVHGRERPAGLLVRNNTFEQRDPFVSLSEKYAILALKDACRSEFHASLTPPKISFSAYECKIASDNVHLLAICMILIRSFLKNQSVRGSKDARYSRQLDEPWRHWLHPAQPSFPHSGAPCHRRIVRKTHQYKKASRLAHHEALLRLSVLTLPLQSLCLSINKTWLVRYILICPHYPTGIWNHFSTKNHSLQPFAPWNLSRFLRHPPQECPIHESRR